MKTLILSISLCIMTLSAQSARAKLVACVGASNTYGFNLANRQSDCYPAQLATMLQAFDPEWDVRNFGVNGACVLQRGSLPYIRQIAFSEARACNPDVVLIQLGGNDSVPANWVYKSDFLADFLVLIDAFVQLPSQPQVYVLSSPPFYSNPYGIDNNVIQEEISPLIAQLPTYRNVQLIDLYSPMEYSRNLFQNDGIHFTVEGARLVAEIAAATILGVCGTPDFNGDGKVDIADLILLIEHWDQTEPFFDIAPIPLGDDRVDANDLQALMQYWGREVTDPTLIAHWNLDEAEGSIAEDKAGDNYGALHNEPLWQPEGGKKAGVLQLDGIDDYMSTDFIINPADGPFSIFAWIQGGAPGVVVISQLDGIGRNGKTWLGMESSSGKFMSGLVPPPMGRFIPEPLRSESVITDGQWHHIGFVWDGLYRSLYVDGVEVTKDTKALIQPLMSSTGGLFIGTSKDLDTGTFFSGLIDDIRIYDVALSAEQIAALAQ